MRRIGSDVEAGVWLMMSFNAPQPSRTVTPVATMGTVSNIAIASVTGRVSDRSMERTRLDAYI